MQTKQKLHVEYVPITNLRPAEYNPRKHDADAEKQLAESVRRFGVVDPLIVNRAPERKDVVIGGHFRLQVLAKLGYTEIPVVYVNIPNVVKEKELNLRLNKNTGEFDLDLLAQFDESLLADVGFSTIELDSIFAEDDIPEVFDLEKELEKLDITTIEIKKGDVWKIGDAKLMCGDSTVSEDMEILMAGEKADMCMTDPPYRLDYLKGKKRAGKATEGFGLKRDRKYLETDELPEDFTEKWMANVAASAKQDFSIICYENWKNLREIWECMEKHWRIRNMIVWHLPNRTQGFSAKYKFFSKHDIAMVGTSDGFVVPNAEPESVELFQNEYESALYATSGKPHWESYAKGKKSCPTDFIDHIAADEKSSGQAIIFGTKPLPILIPYIKVLTKRGDLVVEPFGGSGSTAAASLTIGRRCNIMEKVPAYAEVIRRRLEILTGLKAEKIHEKREAQTKNN